MKVSDTLQLVFNSMKYKRLRTVLTIFGILIGPAAIVALLSITQGFSGSITSELGKIGVTSIYITTTGTLNLTAADVSAIAKLPNVTAVMPFYSFSGNVHGNSSESVTVYALDSSQLSSIIPSLSLLSGSISSGSSSAVVGFSIAYPNVTGEQNITAGKILQVDLSKGGSSSFAVGRQVGIQSKTTRSFLVSGVYGKFGQGLFLSPDSSVFIPLSEGRTIEQSSNYTGIFVKVNNASSVTATVSELEALLGNGARATAVSSLLSSITSIENSVSTLLIGIAGISLIVAFTGIMTTMFTAVTERTREIGVLKALGFTSKQVLVLFVSESLIIGLIGGTIGALAGGVVGYFGAPLLMSSLSAGSPGTGTTATSAQVRTGSAGAGFSGTSGGSFGGPSSGSLTITPTFDLVLIVEVLILTSLMGAVAGLLPAWRAAKLVPAEALRSL